MHWLTSLLYLVAAALILMACCVWWRELYDGRLWAIAFGVAAVVGVGWCVVQALDGGFAIWCFASVSLVLVWLACTLLLPEAIQCHSPKIASLARYLACGATMATVAAGLVFAGRFVMANEQAVPQLLLALLQALACVLVLKCWAHHAANVQVGSPQADGVALVPADLSESDGGKILLVLIHGMGGPVSMSDLRQLTEDDERFDVLPVRYFGNNDLTNGLSNRDPRDVAQGIVELIDERWRRGGHQRIWLLGHSFGSLLARQVVLLARGRTSEFGGRTARPAWSARVDRVVMLAGLNRGLNIEGARPSDMSSVVRFGYWFGSYVGELLGVGGFARSALAGSPFVANLRMDWARFCHSEKPDLDVVQLLGDIDDVVSESDAADFLVSGSGARFHPMAVRGTGHADITRVATAPGTAMSHHERRLREYRREKVVRALADPLPEPTTSAGGKAVARVLVALHGIRDLGRWAAAFEREVERAGGGCVIESPRYGYFGMGPFLLKASRGKYVRWLMDEMTDIVARHPGATIDFFGHSNGTYLFAKALQDYCSLRVRRAVFAGSVVHSKCEFRAAGVGGETAPRRHGTVEELLNLRGSTDWVVALFPSLFEHRVMNWANPLVGRAGFCGFDPNATGSKSDPHFEQPRAALANRQIAGSHGAYEERVEDIVAFLASPGSFDDRVEAFAEPLTNGKPIKPCPVLTWGAQGGQIFVYLFLAVVVFAVGAWLIGAAGPYSTQVAIVYVGAVGYVLMKV